MFWLYIFPVLFAFPLVLPLCLFFLATVIRVFFSNSSELDHGSCGFERGSTVPLPCFLLPVLPSAHPSVSFLYSPCSFFFFFWCVCVLLLSFPLCSFLSPFLSRPLLSFSLLSSLVPFLCVFLCCLSSLCFCFSLLLFHSSPFSPSFFSLSSLCFYHLFPPFFHRLSLAFISQRMACSATSNLVTACLNSSRETFPITEAICCFCC